MFFAQPKVTTLTLRGFVDRVLMVFRRFVRPSQQEASYR